MLDSEFRIRSANTAFFEDLHLDRGLVMGSRFFEIGNGEWNLVAVRNYLGAVAKNLEVEPLELRMENEGSGVRTMVMRARRIEDLHGPTILLAIEDATRRAEAEETRNVSLREMVLWEEKERHRLAMELHDEAGQHVTAFLLGLGALKTSQTEPAAAAVIGKLQTMADELAQRLHGLSLQLRPTALDEHGLERALESLVEDVSHRQHQMEMDLQISGRDLGRLPQALETVIYRVVQESLTNVVKHSGATKVSLVLDRTRSELRLAIEANGVGFDRADLASHPDHLGLRGMEERVNLAGGRFWVESVPGDGAAVFVRIPLTSGGEVAGQTWRKHL
jgi:signal transduction histidine kinase